MPEIFFKSANHKARFTNAMHEFGKVYDGGKFDPEYAAAFYILTADQSTWSKSYGYVSRHGIQIDEMLEEVDFSSGQVVLLQLAGNLFNGTQHIDPLEFLRLDHGNFNVALTAMLIRRDGYRDE
jgi:Family of unknown function (DUF6075)